MDLILIGMTFVVLPLLAYGISRFYPRATFIFSLCLIGVGLLIPLLPHVAPQDYLQHIPANLQRFFDPWGLAADSIIAIFFGMGICAGCGIRKVIYK